MKNQFSIEWQFEEIVQKTNKQQFRAKKRR